MLKLDARPQPSRLMSLASPLLALVLTAILAGALFLALGKDPVKGLSMYFVVPLSSLRQISEVLLKATPLIIIGLGLAVCYRSNVWNIGAEGQYLLGVLGGGGIALWLSTQGIVLPKIVAVTLVMIGGVLGGMAWAAIVALLRDRFNTSEILVSLMLVYVAQQLVNYMVFGPWKDPRSFGFPQTRNFDPSTWLPKLIDGTRLHIGIVIALVLAALAWVFMFRIYRGYQLQVGGLAPLAARYAGFSTRTTVWTALMISGGLAGLAGAIDAIGSIQQITPHVSAGLGFTAIIVCFVGRLNPVGIVFAGLLLSMMIIGGELGQSRLGLPNALTGMFQGLLLVLLLACDTLINFRIRLRSALSGAH